MASCYEDSPVKWICPDGGTGRRAGLKIRFSQESGSSTLPLGTISSQSGSKFGVGFIAARSRLGLCGNLNQIKQAYPPVDMSEWLAYR